MITADPSNTSFITPSSTGVAIHLTDAGKRFNREWIFRHLTYSFEAGKSYAITGPNGSGKSTLLQAIAGSMLVSEGGVSYQRSYSSETNNEPETANGKITLEPESIYQCISIAAPYLELIEEMTAKEFLLFHHRFKPFISTIEIDEILSIAGLEKAAGKQIRYYSSGMKQRLKLAQAVFSDVPVLLLDEPCTNLDSSGYELYHSLIQQFCSGKLVIVSSNDALEMDFCTERLSINDFK